jgi:phage regulator Rha-like protein
MERRTLIPRNVIDTTGSIYYDEKSGTWSIIRIKADLVKEFPQLKEKRSKFSYQLTYYRTIKELEKAIRALKNQKDASLPVMMWLYKEREAVS